MTKSSSIDKEERLTCALGLVNKLHKLMKMEITVGVAVDVCLFY